MKCGFKIGGGIDQDYRKSPQGYTDNVRTYFVLEIYSFIFSNIVFSRPRTCNSNNFSSAL